MDMMNWLRNTYWGFLFKRCWYNFRRKSLSDNQQMTEDDFNLGWGLYHRTDASLVKPKRQVISELNCLYKYWHCFPDTYFRFGMFLRECTDWARMTSFLPQIAAVRYESQGAYREYGILLDDKIIFNEVLSSFCFPVSQVYFRYMHHRFFVKGDEQSDQQIEFLLQHLSLCRVFAKPSTGSCAKGIFVLSKLTDDQYEIIRINNPVRRIYSGGGGNSPSSQPLRR